MTQSIVPHHNYAIIDPASQPHAKVDPAKSTGFSWFVGFAATRFATSGPRLYRGFITVCGIAAMTVGVFWF